jgi:eukaryotic-like serine/threonine-protein kinase
MLRKIPLGWKVLLASASLVLLSVALAMLITNLRGNKVANEAVREKLDSAKSAQAAFQSSRAQQLALITQNLAGDPNFVSYITSATAGDLGLGGEAQTDTASIRDQLDERRETLGFDLAIVLDGEGFVLARTDESEAVDVSLADDALIQQAMENGAANGLWRQSGALFEVAVAPLVEGDNVQGYLLIGLNINDALAKSIQSVSGTEVLYLVAGDQGEMQLAASSAGPEEGKRLMEGLNANANAMGRWQRGEAVDRVDLTLDGTRWVGRVTPLKEASGQLAGASFALTSLDQALSGFKQILNALLIGGVLAVMLAWVLSYLLARGILKPLRQLADAANAASKGDFQMRLKPSSNDELGRLTGSLDSLLSELREKKDMEGYVYDLSRYLPDPAQQPVAVVRTTRGPQAAAQRETLTLLGLEFRSFAKLPADAKPDELIAELGRLIKRAEALALMVGGQFLGTSGLRCVVGFAGDDSVERALKCLAQLMVEVAPPDARGVVRVPAAALAQGEVLTGAQDLTTTSARLTLGLPGLMVSRLLEESMPGLVFIAPQLEAKLKSIKALPAVLPVAQGAVSGKRFFALKPSQLPTMTMPDPVAGAAGVPTVGVPAPTPGGEPLPTPGALFGGRYEIQAVLGTGGMGIVYKARDLDLDDFVALKMLRAATTRDKEQLESLKTEIRLARRITHPNVVRTFDFGEIHSLPFITMEYVRGMTMRYLLSQRGRLPFSAALRLARQVCAGLHAAHEVGVLHRDIKPENVILDQNGNAKLMDFGIARSLRRTDGSAQPDEETFLGTPLYAAPEQFTGSAVDARTDIYSTGVMMCEMFCGNLPFSGGNTMEIYMAHAQQPPIKPSELWPDVPPELEAIILKCLSKRPDDRFPGASALGAALAELRA